jgi:FtsZ-interacting cell division protein ZipA
MDNNAIVWIVVAVVAVIVIVALLLAARKRRNQRRHVEAKQIREDLTTHVAKVDKREALADETAARARAAEAEAEAKAAEAARLKDQADSHRGVVAESREEIEERRRHADRIDPKTKVRDDADDSHGVKHDDAARDSAAQRDAAAQQDAARRDTQRR